MSPVETHGRWPVVAATAVATTSAAAVSQPALRPLAASIAGLRALANDPKVSRRSLQAGAAGGLTMSAALVPILKWRIRHRAARPSH